MYVVSVVPESTVWHSTEKSTEEAPTMARTKIRNMKRRLMVVGILLGGGIVCVEPKNHVNFQNVGACD